MYNKCTPQRIPMYVYVCVFIVYTFVLVYCYTRDSSFRAKVRVSANRDATSFVCSLMASMCTAAASI